MSQTRKTTLNKNDLEEIFFVCIMNFTSFEALQVGGFTHLIIPYIWYIISSKLLNTASDALPDATVPMNTLAFLYFKSFNPFS